MFGPYMQHRLWDPLRDKDLANGLILDLCPEYIETVTQSSGLISQIKDRSPYANHFEASGAQRPTFTQDDAVYGNRASLLFSGGQQLQTTTTMQGIAGSGQCTHAVVYYVNTTAVSGLYQMGVIFPPTKGDYVYFGGGNVNQYIYPGPIADTTTFAQTTPYRSVLEVDIGTTTHTGVHYRNGTNVASTSGAGTAYTFGSGDAWIIGSLNNSSYFTGSIARFLSWNRALSAPEIAAVDAGLKSFCFL